MALLEGPSLLGQPYSLRRWLDLGPWPPLPIHQGHRTQMSAGGGFREQLRFPSGPACQPLQCTSDGTEESIWSPLLASFSLGSLLCQWQAEQFSWGCISSRCSAGGAYLSGT